MTQYKQTDVGRKILMELLLGAEEELQNEMLKMYVSKEHILFYVTFPLQKVEPIS